MTRPPAALPGDLAASLRRHDRERYLTTLFAPAQRRPALVALYAFNLEIAKLRETVREPLLGRIRLQWWREAIDEIYAGGALRRHEVVEPLAQAVRDGALDREHLDALIDAREADLADEPPADMAVLERYAEDSSARLLWLALESLGIRDQAARDAARHVGIAWALLGVLRALPFHARAGRRVLPENLVREHGLDERSLSAGRATPPLTAVTARIAGGAGEHLRAARSLRPAVSRAALPAVLLAPLAAAHLRRLVAVGHDPFDAIFGHADTLAAWRLGWAAALGRY